ncbi:macro domain-containing protein [Pseudochryseolinea flava]|uniref:Phage tail protein n=1 Tax=Pseudochryseolinea flava TaxID=2059302 RepID=A0A364XVT3_9BACT|nr:macro domain-containing protein [Pseudochryseolinea flava]RAV98437.1 phage tail protein [Pseudochryseolinea flava]
MTISLKQFELTLVDVQVELCEAWKYFFKEFSGVIIHHGKFQEVKEFDCLVSPANSFGLMDGGIDLAIRNYFGMQIQENVRKVIEEDFYGEQPVGSSIIVDTGNENHPFLAHTPTMRVPSDISNTDNVYNATFAMLRAVANHNKHDARKIKKILCPGLGTATGRVSPKEAARQMVLAYRNFINPSTNLVWPDLMKRNREVMKSDE